MRSSYDYDECLWIFSKILSSYSGRMREREEPGSQVGQRTHSKCLSSKSKHTRVCHQFESIESCEMLRIKIITSDNYLAPRTVVLLSEQYCCYSSQILDPICSEKSRKITYTFPLTFPFPFRICYEFNFTVSQTKGFSATPRGRFARSNCIWLQFPFLQFPVSSVPVARCQWQIRTSASVDFQFA